MDTPYYATFYFLLLLPLKFLLGFAILIMICLGVGLPWIHLIWDAL